MRILLAPVLVAGLGLLLASGESYAQVQPCTNAGCIGVSVSSPDGTFSSGQSFSTTISYTQGSADLGLNNEAAIAFTLSIPSLTLANCDSPTSDGLTSAIVPSSNLDQFRVVVENTVCKGDGKPCLCPTASGDTQANYMNFAIFGPKVLPTPGSGTVDFPTLQTGDLVTISLTVGNPSSSPLTLHVYNQTDNQGTTPKPQFGALASVGNTSAVDDSVNTTTSTSNITFTDGSVNVSTSMPCVGDCKMTCMVTLADLRIALNIFTGLDTTSTCQGISQGNLAALRQALNTFVAGGTCPNCTAPTPTPGS